MFKKYNYFQNFPALNIAINYGAIIFTAAVYARSERVVAIMEKLQRMATFLITGATTST